MPTITFSSPLTVEVLHDSAFAPPEQTPFTIGVGMLNEVEAMTEVPVALTVGQRCLWLPHIPGYLSGDDGDRSVQLIDVQRVQIPHAADLTIVATPKYPIDDRRKVAMGMALVGHNVAYVNTSYGQTEQALTTAHELGHLLGAGSRNDDLHCIRPRCIMGPVASAAVHKAAAVQRTGAADTEDIRETLRTGYDGFCSGCEVEINVKLPSFLRGLRQHRRAHLAS